MRRSLVVVIGGMALVLLAAAGCSGNGKTSAVTTLPTSRLPDPAHSASTVKVPPTVNGVPLAALAKEALQTVTALSDPRPTNVQVVLSTEARIANQMHSYGPAVPAYVVAMDGEFRCGPSCGVLEPGVSEPGSQTAVRYIVFTDPLPFKPGSGGSLYAGDIRPDLSVLGHVYDLQPYIASQRNPGHDRAEWTRSLREPSRPSRPRAVRTASGGCSKSAEHDDDSAGAPAFRPWSRPWGSVRAPVAFRDGESSGNRVE